VVPSVRASQVCRDQSGTLKWDRFFKGVPGFEEEKDRTWRWSREPLGSVVIRVPGGGWQRFDLAWRPMPRGGHYFDLGGRLVQKPYLTSSGFVAREAAGLTYACRTMGERRRRLARLAWLDLETGRVGRRRRRLAELQARRARVLDAEDARATPGRGSRVRTGGESDLGG
jgi:hypothetical protein